VRVFSEGTKATETPEQANRRRYNGGEVDSPARNLSRFIAALPDAGIAVDNVPKPLRQLTFLTALVLAATLITGTLVTGAGPHAGDKSLQRPVPRLQIEIVTLVHAHANLLVGYLSLLIGLGAGLLAVGASRRVRRRLVIVLAVVATQGLIGVVQYHTGVPAVLVALHVAGAAGCTAATAALWASMRQRTAARERSQAQALAR
jgi:cytochrome c oxidase assembly protein subunit 15